MANINKEEQNLSINFNEDSVFKLTPIALEDVIEDVTKLLINGEEILYGFETIRDQLIFTSKRIIAIDVQGITGAKKAFATMPYAKVQYFTVQTPGFIEILPDSELFLMFTNGFTARFLFKGNVDITAIGRLISEFIL